MASSAAAAAADASAADTAADVDAAVAAAGECPDSGISLFSISGHSAAAAAAAVTAEHIIETPLVLVETIGTQHGLLHSTRAGACACFFVISL